MVPFVGREKELAALADCRLRARGGEAQFVRLCGEAGIGKTRLVEEFQRRAEDRKAGAPMAVRAAASPIAVIVANGFGDAAPLASCS